MAKCENNIVFTLVKKLNILGVSKRDESVDGTTYLIVTIIVISVLITLVAVLAEIFYSQKHYTFECEHSGHAIAEKSGKYEIGLCACDASYSRSFDLHLLINKTVRDAGGSVVYQPGTYYVKDAIENTCTQDIVRDLQRFSYRKKYYQGYLYTDKFTGIRYAYFIYDCDYYGICIPNGDYIAVYKIFGTDVLADYGQNISHVYIEKPSVMCCGFEEVKSSQKTMMLLSFIGGALAITHFIMRLVFEPFMRRTAKASIAVTSTPMLGVVMER